MTQSKIQELQISWEVKEWEARRALILKTFSLVNPRMNRLWKEEFYLEIVLVHSQTIEHYIKTIIQGHLVKRKILTILNENDPQSQIKIEIEEDAPLGSLIGVLKKFIGKTALISSLTSFNTTIRREVAHHIFVGQKDVDSLTENIKLFFGENWQGKGFREMVDGLKEESKKINEQIKEIIEKSK